ncbi:hypothetical protein CVT26_002418 [Gymnopilus dilepis]|uniref:Uncharacterized protein n=1 Tax=Gymnopilus dilepis TaxID=231916 RepID=A0A409Y3A6_9AGAR|nr:hypothetical protein CVT26_002418 [Gymnopilus dilepis]
MCGKSENIGRKDNPVVIVDFNYQSQDIPIGVEITREAFLTALGMPTVPSLSLPVQGLSLTGVTSESTLERINRYIQDDKEDQLGLRVQMGEYDKEFIRTLGQTIDEAEYLLDQIPPPSPDDDELVKKLRKRLEDFLSELRKGAEGVMHS